MAAIHTGNIASLIRSELWQSQLEETLYEPMMATESFVRSIDFPDGSAFTMVSLGTATVRDLSENAEVTFDGVDSGEKQLTLSETTYAASSISEKVLQDSFWANQMMARLPVDHSKAVMERFLTDTFALANTQALGTGNANNINGVAHRRVASGTNETMAPQDFALAAYSLIKAKVPDTNLIAIVDPSVAYALETSSNLVNVSNNPQWQGIIETGIAKNMRFVRNVYGFDVYTTNFLADANETIGGRTTAAGKANIFLHAGDNMLLPFMCAWKKRPTMEQQWDMIRREQQVVTTARWGMKISRDDNLVVILSDTDQVA